jgi:predicted ATPase
VGAQGHSRPAPATGVRVHLLGAFAVAVDDRPVPESAWRLRKARTLVKLLALAPGHRLHREQVIAVLWPDRPPAAAANNLHQVLHVARRQLDGGDTGRRCLRLEDDVLSLSAEEQLWIDAEAFRGEAVAALRSGDAQQAGAALELYTGTLLPEDLYEDWTEPARAELAGLQEELVALARGAGPARAGAAARSDNLPAELTTFIGREAELDEVARLLRRGPLVTVAGAAGCGKTRLGLEVAARQRERFRDGVWLVELAPVSQPDLVADAIATALGLKPGRQARGIAALAEALASFDGLVVLDNCDHLVAACAHAAEVLLRGCPELQVLATSREPLGVSGEIVWRVPSLTLPEAGQEASPAALLRSESVRLFVDRAGAAQPGFALTDRNGADIARICQSLDGLPLAIELAAARVGSLPPAEIAARLGESFTLLRQERRTAEARQQTLEGALDWSYRLLDDDEAALLRRLAVFAGSFDLGAVEAVCGTDEAVDVLLRLVRKSLVVAEDADGAPRYRLLEMIRQYARERLAEAGESAALSERHARWYLELPERLGAPGSELRLRRLDLEPDNHRAALAWLLEHDPPAALRLADSLGDWWLMRGRLIEGRGWLEAAVERSPESTPAAAAALLRAVGFAGRAGGMSEGTRLAERSLAISRALGDRAGVAQALHVQGVWAWLRGPYATARDLLESAIEEARLAGSPTAEANAMHALGLVAASQRDLPRARELLEATLGLLEELREESPPDFVVTSLGLVPLVVLGEPVRRVVQEDSQITFRRVGARAAVGYVRTSLAVVARLAGDPADADVLLGDALARLRAVGDEAGIAHALAGIGRLATLEGERDRAYAALHESLGARRRLGDVRSVGLTLALQAELAAAGGDLAGARALIEHAIAMFDDVRDRPGVLWVLGSLAHVELSAGRVDVARVHLESALAACEELGTRVMRGWTRASLAEAGLRAAAPERARRLLAGARDDLEYCGDAWGLERCAALEQELLSER